MRLPGIAILGLVFCAGCAEPSIGHTSFFSSHDARTELDALAKARGLGVGTTGGGHSLGGPTGQKNSRIAIRGSRADLDALMRDYKTSVESALTSAGGHISGRGTWDGESTGFDFAYERLNKPAVRGVFRANGVMDDDGYIQIDVFLYEHQ